MEKKIPPLASKQLEPLLVSISDIHPHPDNYKSHPPDQIRSLKASLKAFAWTTPIKANLEGTIIAGHGMYQVALEEGYTHVPVEFCALDKQLSKAYLVADNETARKAVTEDGKLSELLKDIEEIPDFDIEAAGFSLEDVDSLIGGGPTEVTEDDFKPGEEVETRCKEGDLWGLGSHRLLCGSSLDEVNVKRLLGSETVDMLLTDPPYGVDYSSKNEMLNAFDKGNHVQRPIQNDAIENYREFFGDFLKIIPFSDYNTIYIFMSGQELHNVRLAFDDVKIKWGDYLVWAKNNHVLGRKDYNSKHEFCVYGWKNHHKFYGDFSTTILEFDKPTKSDLHPTMKPIPLFSKLIQDGSLKGMNVYDPFCGSGTSIIACEQLGRKAFACELEPHYADVIITRWEQFTGKTAKKLN